MKKEIITRSEKETMDMAFELGRSAKAGDVFALYGDLGTGKTIIAKGMAKGMGIDEDITSPTFLMLEIYDGGRLPLYHFDLYRINSPEELDTLNFEEYWEGAGVSVIEWAEKAEERFPSEAVRIWLERTGNEERRMIIEYPDN